MKNWESGVCVCVEENITEHEVTEAKGLGQGGDTRPESTRPKPHTHTRKTSRRTSHSCPSVNSSITGRNVSFPEDVHTFTHTQGSSYLPAHVSLRICDSLVFWVRGGTLSVNVFMSVLWWCRATDSMSDDNDDDDFDGQGWAKLAGWLIDKGNFQPGISKCSAGQSWTLLFNRLSGKNRAWWRLFTRSSGFDLPPPPPPPILPSFLLISYSSSCVVPPSLTFVLLIHLLPHMLMINLMCADSTELIGLQLTVSLSINPPVTLLIVWLTV